MTLCTQSVITTSRTILLYPLSMASLSVSISLDTKEFTFILYNNEVTVICHKNNSLQNIIQ